MCLDRVLAEARTSRENVRPVGADCAPVPQDEELGRADRDLIVLKHIYEGRLTVLKAWREPSEERVAVLETRTARGRAACDVGDTG